MNSSLPPPATVSLPCGLSYLRDLNFPKKYGVLDRLYGHALGRHGVAVFPLKAGVIWKLDARSVSHRFCIYGSSFGPRFAKWLRTFLASGGTVIDSGANIGQTVAEFIASPGLRVHAFEPVAECRDWIEECLAMNACQDVAIVPAGLSDNEGAVRFQVAGNKEIHAAHSTMRLDWYQSRNNRIIEIPVLRLDEYAEQHGIASIRFWKLDVEGAEWQAVLGAERLLERQGIDALLVEISGDNRERLPRYLKMFGYLPHNVKANGSLSSISHLEVAGRDVLFLPSEDEGLHSATQFEA